MSDSRPPGPSHVWIVSELGPGPGEWIEGCYTTQAAAEVHAGRRVARWAIDQMGTKPVMSVYRLPVARYPDDD